GGCRVEGGRGRRSKYGGDQDHDRKILVDQSDAVGREPEIDHTAERDRSRERGQRGDQKRDERERDAAAVARRKRPQGEQRPQPAATRRRYYRGARDPGVGVLIHGRDPPTSTKIRLIETSAAIEPLQGVEPLLL